MQIGQVIRKYRKERNLTQEEMANRLGVTAPAVNKWENGNTYPDITMLAPIARLLNISLDTLLSFHEELSEEEIKQMIYEADEQFKQKPYAEVFQWIKSQIEMYPNCEMLIWQLAVLLDAQRMIKNVADAEKYDDYILGCYERVLESKDEMQRTCAADSLFGYYVRKECYEKAETYLQYYSQQNPERKRKQALIYSKTDRRQDAYKAYEELLFSGYQMLSLVFNSICMLAMQDDDRLKSQKMVEKQQKLARVFEMGVYHEVSCGLDLATAEKDVDAVIEIMQKLLESLDKVTEFIESDLYEHMIFKKPSDVFVNDLKTNLLECFRDEETYGFLKEDVRWQKIVR